MLKTLYNNIWLRYYWYIFLFYCIALYSFNVRIGVLASIVMIFAFLPCVLIKFKMNIFDYIVIFFIFWNILSFFFFSFSNLPLSVYVREFSNSVLPIGFYYLGKIHIQERLRFYHNLSLSILAILISGLFLFLYQPDFYRVYLDNLEGIGLNIISSSSDFRSLVGLTMTGTLSFVLVAYSTSKMLESQAFIWKLLLLLALTCGFITFRRSAMVVILLQIVFYALIVAKISFSRFLSFLTVTLFLSILLFLYLIQYVDLDLFYNLIIERLSLLGEGIDERKDSWYGSFAIANWMIGDGLGVYGHKAVDFSDIYIPDGYYFRLIAELGIPGFLTFSAILVSSILKSVLRLDVYFFEFSIILGLSLQAIGSDIFSFQLIAPLFWFCSGIVLGGPYIFMSSHERD